MLRDLRVKLEVVMLRRELSKAERLLSMKKRLFVDMNGFRANYEEV
jgi:hypothetical protein